MTLEKNHKRMYGKRDILTQRETVIIGANAHFKKKGGTKATEKRGVDAILVTKPKCLKNPETP